MGDILIWVTIEVIFGYLFYITGALILRLISFGKTSAEFHSFSFYKELKKANSLAGSRAHLVGLLFYVVILSLLVIYYASFT